MVARIVSFKIDESLLERLDLLAKRMGRSRSELLRMIIAKYVDEKETEISRAYLKTIRIY